MSYGLNSLKGVIWGSSIGVIKGDTRGLDYSSCRAPSCTPLATVLKACNDARNMPVIFCLSLLSPVIH